MRNDALYAIVRARIRCQPDATIGQHMALCRRFIGSARPDVRWQLHVLLDECRAEPAKGAAYLADFADFYVLLHAFMPSCLQHMACHAGPGYIWLDHVPCAATPTLMYSLCLGHGELVIIRNRGGGGEEAGGGQLLLKQA